MMTKRDYYALEEVAEKLDYKNIKPLICKAANGELSVFILTRKYFVKATHIDADGVIVGTGSKHDKLAKLTRYCLDEYEANNKEARAIIEPEPFYEHDAAILGPMPPDRLDDIGRWQNGEFRFELRHKDFLYPEPITQDNFMQYPGPVLIKDCELVILHDDFKRLQEPEPKAEVLMNDGVDSQAAKETGKANKLNDTPANENELTAWLREIWKEEGKPGGTKFFSNLKKYSGVKGSPIIEYYSAGREAGIKWVNSKGGTGELKKSTILNKVSIFKKTP
jgi:hypothetical protein